MQNKKVSENVIKFVFYFLRSVHRFCLFVDFIERLMIYCHNKTMLQFTIKLCANIILFFLFTCCITIEHNEGMILFFFFVNKPKLLIQISILFSRFNFSYSPGTIFINEPNFRSSYCNSRKVMKIRFRTTLLEQEHIQFARIFFVCFFNF